jgi:hypothetical protein
MYSWSQVAVQSLRLASFLGIQFEVTAGTRIPDKSGIQMVDNRKNWASVNRTIPKPDTFVEVLVI